MSAVGEVVWVWEMAELGGWSTVEESVLFRLLQSIPEGTFYFGTHSASVNRRYHLPPLRHRLLPKFLLIPVLSHGGRHS